MINKINLGLLLGGRSCEHEISVISAHSILKAIDTSKYHVHLIGIDKSGHWHLAKEIEAITKAGSVCIHPEKQISLSLHSQGNLIPVDEQNGSVPDLPVLDVIFPVLHGTFGEDGTLQGVLEMAGIPYVGCGVAASALAMDKALAKKVFEATGLPQAPYRVATASQWRINPEDMINDIEAGLGYPVFVKPANLGSSVGVGKAKTKQALWGAINHAFEFDNKIVVEQSMENCHEIECSVLGNEDPRASVVGEIIPGAEFYNYETKYIDDKSRTIIPAPLSDEVSRKIQALSIAAFKAIDGAGLARVDFFVDRETMEITLNEVNTLPGFTPISMYPQLWAASGLAYADLIDRLIALAIEQHQSKQTLKRVF